MICEKNRGFPETAVKDMECVMPTEVLWEVLIAKHVLGIRYLGEGSARGVSALSML